jgi:hypothetical protein
MRRTFFLLSALLLLPPCALRAQVTPADSARARPDSAAPRPDSAQAPAFPAQPDSAGPRRVTPRGAFMRSLILPGWGQSEVGAPERGVIYFALESGSLWMVYKSHQKLQEARDREAILRAAGEVPFGQHTGMVRDRLAQREDWITLSVFWLFFSGADAFVAAHLRDFDAHVGVGPAPNGGAQLQVNVPTGTPP